MHASRIALTTLLALGLTACSVTGTNEVMKPAEQRGGFMGLSTAEAIKVERETPFKGVQKVAIASFKVGFVHGKIESRKAGRGYGGNSAAGIKLKGVEQSTMQAITDAAYADFTTRMKQAGYTIVDRETLKAQPDFAKARPETSPQIKEASFFGDQTEMTTLAPSSHGDFYWFTGESIGNSGGFGFSNASTAAMTQYGKTGIKVLSVYYVIDFAASSGSGGTFSATSSVKVGQALSLSPGGGLSLFGGDGMVAANHSSSIKLGQPIYAEETFGEMVKTSSDAAVGVETGLNVVRALAGMGTSQRRDFEVQADATRYDALSRDLLAQANGKLVERMASLR